MKNLFCFSFSAISITFKQVCKSMFLLLKMISANYCKWVKYSANGGFFKGLWKSHRMGHFQILESAGICVLEYKRKPIEMTEFQWVLRNYRIDRGATRNCDKFASSCISSLFRNVTRVISSYCSTVGLLRFAHRCSGWFLGTKIVN